MRRKKLIYLPKKQSDRLHRRDVWRTVGYFFLFRQMRLLSLSLNCCSLGTWRGGRPFPFFSLFEAVGLSRLSIALSVPLSFPLSLLSIPFSSSYYSASFRPSHMNWGVQAFLLFFFFFFLFISVSPFSFLLPSSVVMNSSSFSLVACMYQLGLG